MYTSFDWPPLTIAGQGCHEEITFVLDTKGVDDTCVYSICNMLYVCPCCDSCLSFGSTPWLHCVQLDAMPSVP